MSDYFGYNRPVKTEQLPSADHAVLDIGNGRLGLIQGFSGSYEHQVQPRVEMGSSTLFWVTGQPMGSFTVNRLVGREGLLASFRNTGGNSDACGGLRTLSISLDGGSCEAIAGAGVTMRGVKLQSVAFQGQAGGFDLSESATFLVAEMN